MTSMGTPPAGSTAPPGEEVDYPQAFGPYALLCALGRGGMGAVHLAKHGSVAGIEKYCVVKTLRQKHADNAEYLSRFMDEARLVVHLAHRNICPIFDVGRVGTKYYLAMELIEGRDLNTLVESCWGAGRPLPPALAVHIACEVLEALDYAHRRSHPVSGDALHIVHRDVSPHNVMVNFEGEVKLIDFGLAASSLKVERTDPKIVLGKLSYMSREHLRAQPVDGRHDLFGVGVMLYEMLAGERYYAGVPSDALLPLLADGEHVPRRLGAFDDELRGILGRATARDARARTATCGELRDELQQYMLRRQLSASTRELRALMDELFPGEQTSVRALLQRFQDVHPPVRLDDQSRVIARAGVTLDAPTGDAELRPMSQRRSPLSDALDFGEVDSIGDASGASSSVGHLVPNPITEPTGRIEVAPGGVQVLDDDGWDDQATALVPRVAEQVEAARKARHTAFWAASAAAVVLVAAGAAAWFLLLQPSIAAPEDPAASIQPAAASPTTTEPAPHGQPRTASDDEPRAEGSDDVERSPSVDARHEPTDTPRTVEKKRKPTRRAVRPRSSRTAAKPPPLPSDATPEEKVRYLDSHCRSHACGQALVDRFESVGLAGMSTDEVRQFWPRVNRCIDVCSGPGG